ncbi:CPBP family intramembrane metalloprotease [Weissella minor]|nr:CPBP family intramembrane metalloprotease [Weissella minor]
MGEKYRMVNRALVFLSIVYLILTPVVFHLSNVNMVIIGALILMGIMMVSLALIKPVLVKNYKQVKANPKLLLLFLILFVVTFLIARMDFFPDYISQNELIIDQRLESVNTAITVCSYCVSWFVAPVMESIIMHYVLQRNLKIRLEQRTGNVVFSRILSVFVTFIVFYICHGGSFTPADLLFYFMLFSFCVFYDLNKNNLLLSIVFHSLWNII